MINNKRKQELLSNKFQLYLDEEQSHDQIEMTNFKALNKNGVNYMKLQDQSNCYQKIASRGIQQSIKMGCQRIFANEPIVPNASYNFQPNKIFINGTTFIHKDAIKGIVKHQNKPKKPQMQVTCQRCCEAQIVPANTHSFVCFNCDITQGCNPHFGIFICGSCERKVWYPLGTSTLIKCTRCGTINNIPFTQNQLREQYNPYLPQTSEKINFQQEDNNLNQKYFTQRYPL